VRRAGQVVLFNFPQTDLLLGKLRPVLLIGKLPGPYGDWLICMISSQIGQCVEGFDEIIHEGDSDFAPSGLKATSLVRVGRLAVAESGTLIGSVGDIAPDRLRRLNANLMRWLTELDGKPT
jgi:mRNA interferase MazF